MLIFGHIGITVGVAKACDSLLSMAGSSSLEGKKSRLSRLYHKLGEFKKQTGNIDYRLLIIGSLLPDIIDKPVFLLISGASVSGRAYAHSLLFNTLLLVGGLVLAKYKKHWLLIISISSYAHLLFDGMWANPVTLFWPLLGPIPPGERTMWLPRLFGTLFYHPETYISEILGMLILFIVAVRFVKRKTITDFIRYGMLV